jgi:hypothetical protein
MPEPLKYRRPDTQDLPNRSRSAVLGFCISIPAPLLGYFAAHLPSIQDTHALWLEALMVASPMLIAFALSLAGIYFTMSGSRRLRGRWLAIAGAIISGGWFMALLVLIGSGND